MKSRLTEKNKAMGTLLGQALSNLESGEKMLMESASRIRISPARTRLNELHNRMDASMDGPAIAELLESIRVNGQQEPAEGWRLARPEPDGTEVILISGARRRAVALALGIDLIVELVTEPTDLELIIKMHAENKGRRDYFPLEQAYEWQKFLDAGAFATQTELATKLGEDPTKVSRIMTLLQLPEEVRGAFRDPSTLPLVKGAQLSKLLTDSKDARARAIKAAGEWTQMDGQGSPLAAIFQAAEGKVRKAPPAPAKRLLKEGREVGRIQGGERSGVDLRLSLSRDCPPDAREAVLTALDAHFPDWRKTRVRN